MAVYKTKCGKYFKRMDCGESYYMGESWGEQYGKETCYCPFEHSECEYYKAFKTKFPNMWFADCEGVKVSDNEYDYDNSLTKKDDEISKKSYDAIIAKFGGLCMAINYDGKGGYKIDRDRCYDCWEKTCNITKKERDITKCRIMADVVVEWDDKFGFYEEHHKTLTHRQVTKGFVPREYAERAIKDKHSVYISMFEINTLQKMEIMLGFAPKPEIVRYYIVNSNAKRDLMEDLKAVADGYTVIHESDVIAAKKSEKSARRKVIREEKEKKLKKALFGKRKPKEVQISFDDL